MMRNLALIVIAFSLVCAVHASDWTQWFGPEHNGASDEKISAQWPSTGPKVLWKVPVGDGLGTPAVAGGKVYVMAITEGGAGHGRGGVESLLCLDGATGKQIWAAAVGPTILAENAGNDGPRSTPALADGRVYVVGTYLNIACFDAKTGTPIWAHDAEKEYGAAIQLHAEGIGAWGCSNSPVIDGNLLFVHCGAIGKALMAFDIKTGSVVWNVGDDKLTHSTPTVATIFGQRQVIFLTNKGLVALATDSGKEMWRHLFPPKTSTAISPVVGGDIVYCGNGYLPFSAAYKITKEGDAFKATELWSGKTVVSHWSTPVYHDGYMYGLFGMKEFASEPLKCVEMATGKIMWSQPGFGQGGTALVDGKILIMGDSGQIVLCEASEKGYKELASYKGFNIGSKKPPNGQEKCWNQAVISGGHIFARSSKEVLCLDVSAK